MKSKPLLKKAGVVVASAFVLVSSLLWKRTKPAVPAPVVSPPAAAQLQGTPESTPVGMVEGSVRLLPVSRASANHEWAEGDGMDPKVIEKLAHNPDEFIRMAEENERIQRRQLVYRKDTAAAVVQRARSTGEPVRSLTLPGFDGREIVVEVMDSDLAYSGLSGTFTGRLPGKLQSVVTVAFKNNREAFSISSPEDGLYLEAEPREPGQIVVKAIDPATYAVGHCGTEEYARELEKPRNSH